MVVDNSDSRVFMWESEALNQFEGISGICFVRGRTASEIMLDLLESFEENLLISGQNNMGASSMFFWAMLLENAVMVSFPEPLRQELFQEGIINTSGATSRSFR